MQTYGTVQAGGVPTALSPGGRLVLFDGTETPAAGLTSLPFVRAPGPAFSECGTLFSCNFAANPNATLVIEASNSDVLDGLTQAQADGSYQILFTFTPAQSEALAGYGYVDNYADIGNWKYYRAKLTAYVSGGMPTVIVQR